MLKWYLITAPSKDAVRSTLKSLREQHLMARGKGEEIYACVSNHHQVWLSRVCQDFGAQLKVLDQAPAGLRAPTKEEYVAPCGEKFYDPVQYSQHFRTCEKCGVKPKAKVIAKIEPGAEYNLDGVISSIEVVRDQMWEKVESLDELLTNLKGFRDAKDKLSGLTSEVTKRVAAVKMLINDGRLQ